LPLNVHAILLWKTYLQRLHSHIGTIIFRFCKLFASSWNQLDWSPFATSEVNRYLGLRISGIRSCCSTKGCSVWENPQSWFSERESGRKISALNSDILFFFSCNELLYSSSILLFSFCFFSLLSLHFYV